MTFADWVRESAELYRERSVPKATAESARRFARGGLRRVGRHVGRPIWARDDWDVLIILDACRTDLWRDVAAEYDLPAGDAVWSNASCSIDWLQRNFADRPAELDDVAYVTANPFADHDAAHAQSADLRATPLGHFRPLYETEWQDVDTDPPIETVPPARVTDHAIDCWRQRQELGVNRMVVHYMQPHEPFIARPEWSYQDPDDHAVLKNLVSEDYQAGTSPWQSVVNSGAVSVEEFWPVYCDNLRWVLDDIAGRLLENLAADDVVVSADHGNGLGEWGEWHHPPGAITPAVRRVPWVPVGARDEETVQPDLGIQTDGEDAVDRREQLAALGYR